VKDEIGVSHIQFVACAPDAAVLFAAAPPPETNLFLLAKSRKKMAPLPVELSHLPIWAEALPDEEGCGTYLGSHIFPCQESIAEGQRLPDDMNMAEVPHYYGLRFECDGKGPLPLDDACRKMVAALRVLSHLPHWSFLRVPDPVDDTLDPNTRRALAELRAGRAKMAGGTPESDTNVEAFFSFFCTGHRSIYAVARECSSSPLTGWDAAARDVFGRVNAAAGQDLVDLNIYRTPKAPGRALYTRHEEGTWFNPVPWAWVRDRSWYSIRSACERAASSCWADDLLDATGMLRRAGGAVYDALRIGVQTLRFADDVRRLSTPPRLPVARGRIDYVGLLRERGYYVTREKNVRGTRTYLLDRCPFCGKAPEHAWVSEFGRLGCFAQGCVATERLSARGDDGWLRKLGIELPEEDVEDEADAQDAVDYYPDAREIDETVDIGQARDEIVRRLTEFLKE